jgi:hypothetical protein
VSSVAGHFSKGVVNWPSAHRCIVQHLRLVFSSPVCRRVEHVNSATRPPLLELFFGRKPFFCPPLLTTGHVIHLYFAASLAVCWSFFKSSLSISAASFACFNHRPV